MTTTQKPIADILERISRSDQEALTQLVLQESSRFERFFCQQIAAEDAEDLLQDFWIKVWSARLTYDPKRGCLSWLYTIASRMVIDRFRRQKPEAPLEFELPAAPHFCTLDYERLRQTCFQELPPQQRLVFYLCAVEGMSPAEAAEITKMNPSTLRNHWMLARRRLQQLLRNTFPGHVPWNLRP